MGLLLSVLVVCVSILEVLDCIYHIRVGYLGSVNSWRRRINNAGKTDGGETSAAASTVSAALLLTDVTSPRSRTTSPIPSTRAEPNDDKQLVNDGTTTVETAPLLQTATANGNVSIGPKPNGTAPKPGVSSASNGELSSKPPKVARRSPQLSPTAPPKDDHAPAPTPEDPLSGFHPSQNGSAFKKPARLAVSTDRPVSIRSKPDSPDPWSRKSFPDRALSPSISRGGLSPTASFSGTPSEPTTPKRSKMDISWPTFVPTHVVHRPLGSLSQMDSSFSMEGDEPEGVRVLKIHRLSPIESSADLVKEYQSALDPHEAYRELQKFLEQLNLDSGGRMYSDDEDEDEEPFLNEDFEIDRLFFEVSDVDDSPKPGEEYKVLQEYLNFLDEHGDDPEVYQKWKKTRPSIDAGRRLSTIQRPANPNAEYLALQEFLEVLNAQESHPNEPIVKNWLKRQQAQSEESTSSEDSNPEQQCEHVQERVNLSEHAVESTEPPFVDPAAVRRTLEAAVVVSSDEDEDEEVAAISRLAELRADAVEMTRINDKLDVNRVRSRSPSPQPQSGASPRPPSGTPRPPGSPEVAANTSSPKPAPGEPFWLIFSGEYTKAMSKDWHSGHFCCWQCDESLTGQRYVLRDDHPYCIKCYESVFANACEECGKTIGIDSKDLSYKDKHWHEACFLCSKCRVSLVDKQFGSKADHIYCGNCYDSQFASRCDGCGEIFRAGTKKMEYKTRQWHEKCFCCVVCKTAIGTKSFIPREQEIYCANCYEEKFATRCVKCNKIITSGGVTYKNEPWHRECFTCTHCSTSLAGQRFTSRDEKPYCAECFGELFAKRCTACSKPITGIGGTRFISFEDRHWHNDCFICASCKSSLVGRGFITDGDDIICPECAKQKLM